ADDCIRDGHVTGVQTCALPISIVKPPYLLDFAGAYLDRSPDFPPEVMDQWHEDKAEQFGDRWPDVLAVLELLKTRYGIHLLDIRSEEHTSELQSRGHLVCRLLL